MRLGFPQLFGGLILLLACASLIASALGVPWLTQLGVGVGVMIGLGLALPIGLAVREQGRRRRTLYSDLDEDVGPPLE